MTDRLRLDDCKMTRRAGPDEEVPGAACGRRLGRRRAGRGCERLGRGCGRRWAALVARWARERDAWGVERGSRLGRRRGENCKMSIRNQSRWRGCANGCERDVG